MRQIEWPSLPMTEESCLFACESLEFKKTQTGSETRVRSYCVCTTGDEEERFSGELGEFRFGVEAELGEDRPLF